MIDCDIHTRSTMRRSSPTSSRASGSGFARAGLGLGLPDYPWSHPVDWFRADAEHSDGMPPSTSLEPVRRQVLDAYDEDIGVPTPADGSRSE
jgi:hypothetical protein